MSAHRKLIATGWAMSEQMQRPFLNAQVLYMIRQHPGWDSVLEIFSAPYFRRTWIIQEVAISPVVQLTYAGVLIDWDQLNFAGGKMLEILRDMDQDNKKSEEAVQVFRTGWNSMGQLTEQRRQVKWAKDTGGRITPLIGLLSDLASKNSEATDPRDKIYGLLSLAGDIDKLPRPDYSKSVEEIYTEFARVLYSTGRGIFALAGSENQSLNLPSWVPDWTQPAVNINRWVGPKGEPFIGNTNIHMGAVPTYFRAGSSPDEFVIQGFEIDTIALTGVEMPDNSLNPDTEWFFDFSSWDEVAMAMLLETETITRCTDPSQRIDLYANFIAADASPNYKSLNPGSGRLGSYAGFNVLDFDTNQVTSGQVARDAYSKMQEHVEEISCQTASDVDSLVSLYWGKVKANIARKAFAITTKGYLALVPPSTMIGDQVMIVPSFRNPFVMRDLGGAYQLVNECYIAEYDTHPQLVRLPFQDIILH